jgi:hypothetical protein
VPWPPRRAAQPSLVGDEHGDGIDGWDRRALAVLDDDDETRRLNLARLSA